MNAHELVATATRVMTQHSTPASSPWITVDEAAKRARCSVKLISREVSAGRLRAESAVGESCGFAPIGSKAGS